MAPQAKTAQAVPSRTRRALPSVKGVFLVGDDRRSLPPEAEVDRPVHIRCGQNRLADFLAVAGGDHRHPGQHAGQGDVLQCLMGRPVRPHGNARMAPPKRTFK